MVSDDSGVCVATGVSAASTTLGHPDAIPTPQSVRQFQVLIKAIGAK